MNDYTTSCKIRIINEYEFRCYEVKKEETKRGGGTSGLSCQCSATEPRQLDSHQPPPQKKKSSTCPAQVVLIASVHTWRPLSMCRQNSIGGWLESSAKNPCWVILFTLDALSILLMLVIELIYLDVMRQKVKRMTCTVTRSQTQDTSGLSCHWTLKFSIYVLHAHAGGTESHT